MTKRVAIIFAGSGVYDGSEIYESTITLLRLSQLNADVQCFAPDIEQMHVINHLTGDIMNENRNVLVEAARLARGDIKALSQAKSEDFDALIIPGGFGVAKNLSDFAIASKDLQVNAEVLEFSQAMHKAGKPIGLMCIAPVLTAAIFGENTLTTIGHDEDTASAIQAMGAKHQSCTVDNIIVDENKKLVTTPAYMLANTLAEAAIGINKLVDKVLTLA